MTAKRILGLCLVLAANVQPLVGQQSRWNFTVGAGVGSENVYPGNAPASPGTGPKLFTRG